MRKKEKHIISVILVLCLLFICSACGKQEKKQEETQKETKAVETASLEGTLVSFSGTDLMIEAEEQEYEFDISEATVNTVNMLAGDELVVHYEGKIEGTDTTNVKVISVEDKGGAATSQKEKTAVGTLVKITENSIIIKQNDGTELMFNSNNCEHDFKNGIREGNWIVVTYVGEIQGTDTKNVKVIKITDNDENIVEQEQKKMNIKAVDESVYSTAAVHVRQSYSTDSEILGTLEQGGQIKRTGICDNGWSRVIYNNQDAYIFGDYLTTKAPAPDAPAAKADGTPVEQPAPVQQPQPQPQPQEQEQEQPQEQSQPQEQPQPQENYQEVTGTVVEVSMNTLTFAVDENIYTVYIADAIHQYKNGIQTGNTVTVTYTGNLDDLNSVIVISVVDSDENISAQNAVYKGIVLDATMNTVTIKMADEVEMTFSKEDAVDNIGELKVGLEIAVTADASSADSGSNIMPAKQLDLVEK